MISSPTKRSLKKVKCDAPINTLLVPQEQEYHQTAGNRDDILRTTTTNISSVLQQQSTTILKPSGIFDCQRLEMKFQHKKINTTPTENCITKRIHTLSSAYGVPVLVTLAYILVWVLFLLLAHSLGMDSASTAPSTAKSSSSEILLVISCEALKCMVSLALFICQNSFGDLLLFSKSSSFSALSLKYLPVAICYALYNNLMFGNLKNVSPTLYLILGESRLLLTAVVWQIFFKTSLSNKKMSALILITLGILVKDVNFDDQHHIDNDGTKEPDKFQTFMIVLQIICGVMASVCNEKLLKHLNYNHHLQNIFLYLNSIIVNVLIAIGSSIRGSLNVFEEIEYLTSSKSSAIIIILLVSAGILSAMMLKYVGSVTKGVASASVMAAMPFAEYYWFGHKCKMSDMFSISIVTTGVILYTVPKELFLKIIWKLRVVNWCSINRMYSCSCTKRMKNILIWYMLFLISGGMMIISPVVFSFSHHVTAGSLFQPLIELSGNSKQTCTRHSMHRTRPEGTRLLRYERVETANEIVAYITETINKKSSAPVAIVWGTMLHEYRNGSGPCVLLNFDDKDVDILVFPKQFQMILTMDEHIRKTWKWQIHMEYKNDQFVFIRPMNDKRKNRSHNSYVFQIDIYSFMCDLEGSMLQFPYDNFKLPMKGFLPLIPYKTIMIDWKNYRSNNDTASVAVANQGTKETYLHIPFDPTCLLSNMYGRDFMTPKETREWNTSPFGDVPCKDIETWKQKKDVMHQLTFCQD